MTLSPTHELELNLVRRAQRGDLEAFDGLVYRYRASLVAHMRSQVADSEMAEDLVQEALQRAWHHLDTLQQASSFSSWLRTILLNVYRMWLRGSAQREVPVDEIEEQVDETTNPDTLALDRETWCLRLDALAQLPEENRQALLLYAVERQSCQQIARRLKVPLSTIEGRIQRARQQLRRMLGTDELTTPGLPPPPLSSIIMSPLRYETDESVLLRQLRDGKENERITAATCLGLQRAPAAVPALIAAACEDRNEAVRRHAIYALGRIRDGRAVSPLLDLCDDESIAIRSEADWALRRFPAERLEAPLREALHAADPRRRRRAAACGTYCRTASMTTALSAIIADDADPAVQAAALHTLGAEPNDHTPELASSVVKALAHPHEGLRAVAAQVAGGFADCRMLPLLVAMLHDDPAASVRATAAGALTNLHQPPVTDALLAALDDDAPEVRGAAITALGARKDDRTVEVLLPLLQPGEATCCQAACALAAIGDPRAVPAMLASLITLIRTMPAAEARETGDVLITALISFGQTTQQALREAFGPTQSLAQRLAVLSLLPQFPRDGMDRALVALLGEPELEPSLALAAMRALARRPPFQDVIYLLTWLPWTLMRYQDVCYPVMAPEPGARAMLLLWLRHADATLRLAAAQALAIHGDADAVMPLLAAVKSEGDVVTRRALITSLGVIGDPRALPVLRKVMRDADGDTRMAVAEALMALRDGSGFALLADMLKQDASPIVRVRAAVMLNLLMDAGAVDLFCQIMQHDTNDITREFAAVGLGYLEDARALPALIASLHDPVEWVRNAAVRSLGRIGDRRVCDAVYEGMIEPDEVPLYGLRSRYSSMCSAVLAKLGDARGTDAIPQLLKDPDRHTRHKTSWALSFSDDRQLADFMVDVSDEWQELDGQHRSDYPWALFTLAAMGDPRADVLLWQYLAVTTAYLPDMVHALVQRQGTYLRPRLHRLLEEASSLGTPARVIIAAAALARLGEADGYALLCRTVGAPQPTARYQALRALAAEIPGEPASVQEALARALVHPDPLTCVLAARSLLARDDVRALPPLLSAYREPFRTLPHQLAATILGEASRPGVQQAMRGSRLMPLVHEVLHSDNLSERVYAVTILVASGHTQAVPALQAALRDPAFRVRQAAVVGAGRLGDARLASVLWPVLHDSSTRLREQAAQALQQLRDIASVAPLRARLEVEDADRVRTAITSALHVLEEISGKSPAVQQDRGREEYF